MFQPREFRRTKEVTPELRSAECFLKALLSGELEILGADQGDQSTEPEREDEMDRLFREYEEGQAIWNAPEDPIPPPPTPTIKKVWRKKQSASSESPTPESDDDKNH